MQNTATAKGPPSFSLSEMGKYQQELLEKYKTQNPGVLTANPDNQALTAFTGYYSLPAGGDFFAIDANMIVLGSLGTYYTVDLLIAMSGTTPARVSLYRNV